ncbi:MAG: hypothetical protein ABIH35_04005 [Patescibacteria group bacterium]
MKKYILFGCVLGLAAANLFSLEFSFLPADKWQHLEISAVLFLLILGARISFRAHVSEAVALILSLRDVLIVGLLKEFFDAFGFGAPQVSDLAADAVGILIPFVGLLFVEVFGIGYETLVHSGSRKILKHEKKYFRQQWHFLSHAGIKLFYQI